MTHSLDGRSLCVSSYVLRLMLVAIPVDHHVHRKRITSVRASAPSWHHGNFRNFPVPLFCQHAKVLNSDLGTSTTPRVVLHKQDASNDARSTSHRGSNHRLRRTGFRFTSIGSGIYIQATVLGSPRRTSWSTEISRGVASVETPISRSPGRFWINRQTSRRLVTP